MKIEAYEHAMLCGYLRANYPDAIFTTDLSGVRLPIGLAAQVKPLKSSRGIPDLMVFCPVGRYHGLFMEIKSREARLLNKQGGLLKDEHTAEQLRVITQLRSLGYAAFFVRGFEAGRRCITEYMAGADGEAVFEYV